MLLLITPIKRKLKNHDIVYISLKSDVFNLCIFLGPSSCYLFCFKHEKCFRRSRNIWPKRSLSAQHNPISLA